ncbi:hypothetical protein IEQ44_02535 [Nocardioides sp. Y6]|uniref:Small CPxCG-related zinc finger protein n=1 Tax=Nocardioides malaquae TaxID=2773426 RepID=A0ABR9RPN4_9ACTN|nr:hypothetical protein [Nocardioides malaquae]MBE7323531.1 hypothetical protein [Nocardioides malaquae]
MPPGPRQGYGDDMWTCDRCGATTTSPTQAYGWTTSVEQGRRLRFCVPCSREHLREIEGKLDSDLW